MHPSVAAFAKTLLAGSFIAYAGDPLRDLTLTAFLDKFVQRKPKVQMMLDHWGICQYVCCTIVCVMPYMCRLLID